MSSSIKGIFAGLKTNRKKSEPETRTPDHEDLDHPNSKEIFVNIRGRSGSHHLTKESPEETTPTRRKKSIFGKTPTGSLFFILIFRRNWFIASF